MSVVNLKGFRQVPNNAGMTKAKMDTMCLTREAFEALELPPFQRPLRVNAKVLEIAELMKENGGVIEGVVTIGILNGIQYLVDGQHRKQGFIISELRECYVDVRVCEFETMAEMAEEYVKLNSKIVQWKPDDILRGIEPSNKSLQLIRRDCPFIGYDQIRRGPSSPLLSMSAVLRIWVAAEREKPSATGQGGAAALAAKLSLDQANAMVKFFNNAYEAWGRDPGFYRLWGELNCQLSAWLWRRVVTGKYSQRTTSLTPEQFRKGLMSLSANSNYVEWLVGRNSTERDRGAAYGRIRSIMTARLQADLGKKIILPSPPWFNG